MAKSTIHDVVSLLSSHDRDFLIRNINDHVKIDSLKGKKVGIYFSASWCGPCLNFTPLLVDVYNELAPKGDFEVIFVTADKDDESFKDYFSKMPWLAIPFSDSDTCNRLNKLFDVVGVPTLVILSETGEFMTDGGSGIIREYGVEGYPFTPARFQELQDQEEEAKKNQTLTSILTSRDHDFVISSDGKKVLVSELEGKTIGLYFSLTPYEACSNFTPQLVGFYEKLKADGENFEVVQIPLDSDEEPFKEGIQSVPWLSWPFEDKSSQKLIRYFELPAIPSLVIIGPDGKTLFSNVTDAIEEHGIAAYPFTHENFAKLIELEKAKEASQTLESILVSGELDFVIGKDGVKVPVSELVGKNILLYFSAHWCPPCRAFLPKLTEVYHKIKAKDSTFELIFISYDSDQASFDGYFAEMPWLALPFGDSRKAFLNRKFKVSSIPKLVAIGSNGITVTKEARPLVAFHGADAFPFTDERIKEIEAGWPKKVRHETHEHELVLTNDRMYECDGCGEEGHTWSYCCDDCDFDLHPKCALEEKENKDDDAKEDNKSKDGWVCDGEVCFKA